MRPLRLPLLALALLAASAHAAPSDADADGLPDAAEAQACGRALVELALELLSPLDGSCASPSDYAGPDAAANLADRDADGLPDGLEPVLCGLEDQTDPADGACGGGDYAAPL